MTNVTERNECHDADFTYGTLRVMGNLSRSERDFLWDHALTCKRPDWTHALPVEHWMSVKRQRDRHRDYAAWAETRDNLGVTT